MDEQHQRFGAPTRYYDGGTDRYLDTEAEAQIARKVSGDQMVDDIYEIKTSFNTYQFQIRNFYDERQSRFRPTKKLIEVKFEIDKPVEDVKLLLADFPEAVALCSRECTIFSENGFMGRRLIVQPTNPSQEEVTSSGLMAVGWTDEKPKDTWLRGFTFIFDPLSEKQIESGSYGLMIKGRSLTSEPLTRIGTWQSSPK